MKLFKKRRKMNNKGLSLVELVCAVAIFGVATTAIGSAMVVSAQSYSRGTYELDVQQEAQTTTNLVGNLLIDAVDAEFDKTTDVNNPKLIIQGEGKTYTLVWNKNSGELSYTEQKTGYDPNSGVLAQNVVGFDVDLTKFDTNKNAEVTLKIEKNDRTYEADYNTTSRNGSASTVGAVENVAILTESTIILEPKQVYELPVSVVGPAKDLTVTALSGSGVNGSSVYYDSVKGCVKLSMTDAASGTMTFDISATDDTGAVAAVKSVEVNIRRVNDITSPQDVDNNGEADAIALKSGTAYKADAVYKIEFDYVGTSFAKAYGKSYDLNYIDPQQASINISMSGVTAIGDYVEVLGISYGADPYVELKLRQDMPDASIIQIEVISKHAEGTNKSNSSYAAVRDIVSIKKAFSGISMSGDLNRGNDGVKIVIDSSYMSQLVTAYGNNFSKFIKIYEATYNTTTGKWEKNGAAKITFESTDQGTDTFIRHSDSKSMIADKDYIIEFTLSFTYTENVIDAEGNVTGTVTKTWPEIGVTDPSMYKFEYPLTAVNVVYEKQTDEDSTKGSFGNPYTVTKGNIDQDIEITMNGLDLSEGYKNDIAWIVQKYDSSANSWDTITSGYEVGMMSGGEDGNGKMKLKFDNTGDYRLLTYLDTLEYLDYDGVTTKSGSYNLYDDDESSPTYGQGIFYVNCN